MRKYIYFTFSKYLIVFLSIFYFSQLSYAQIHEGDILADSLIKAGLKVMGRAGYDTTSSNGFYIQDHNQAKFRLNIGAWTQPRYNYNNKFNVPDSIQNSTKGYAMNDTRIFFTGKYTEKFGFRLVINVGEDGEFGIQQAQLTYTIKDKFILDLGKQFIASSREDWMDPSDLMAMQYSANDATFAMGSSFGALLYRKPVNNMRYWVSISNGLYGYNRSISEGNESDVMLGGRFEYQILGKNWQIWDDLLGRRNRDKGILLGMSTNFLTQKESKVINKGAQVNVDASFNGNGFQAMVAGVWTGQFPGGGATNFSNYGFYLQGGYFVTKTVQVYGRYDFVSPGNQPGDFELYSAPGVGVSFLPFNFTNRWKITLEYNQMFSVMNKTIVPAGIGLGFIESDYRGQQSVRFQLQFGF